MITYTSSNLIQSNAEHKNLKLGLQCILWFVVNLLAMRAHVIHVQVTYAFFKIFMPSHLGNRDLNLD